MIKTRKSLEKISIFLAGTALLLATGAGVFCFGAQRSTAHAQTPSPDAARRAETEALEKLFHINSEIELTAAKSEILAAEVRSLEAGIAEAERQIAQRIAERDTHLADLVEILAAQQKLGAGSALQLLLESRSLSDYLQRSSFVSEIGRAYRRAMEQLEQRTAEIETMREELRSAHARVESEREQVIALLQRLEASKIELETYFSGLADERRIYEEHLEAIQRKWSALRSLFNSTVASFVGIIESGGLPPETAELRFSLFGGPKAVIDEAKFNRIIGQRDDLPELVFGFRRNHVTVAFPRFDVILSGRFEIVDKNKLEFLVESGMFGDLPMNEEAMEDLFLRQPFRFDLSGLIGRNELTGIAHLEGRIEISVNLRF